MRRVKTIGGATTKFGRHTDRDLKSLAAEAVNSALEDAGLTKEDIGCVWVGNASQGVLTGQESVRGQVVMRAMGIGGVPVFNLPAIIPNSTNCSVNPVAANSPARPAE